MKNLLVLIISLLTLSLNVTAQIKVNQQAKIDSLFLPWGYGNSPGAAIGIIQEGKLIYAKGYGMANLDYRIPLSADSKFDIGSITKQFTAACIALLSIEGKIELDDNIRKYIPEIPDYGEEITIRNLIHHTSGLRSYGGLKVLSGHGNQSYFTSSDGIRLLARQRSLNFSPGDIFQYSNSGYILMAEIVNRVSGMTIREYADKNIFKPLGMNNTFFNDDRNQIMKDRVIGYGYRGEYALIRYVKNGEDVGAGKLRTTINDMYLWDQNFYHKKVGGKEFIDLMLTQGILNNGDTLKYAFGLNHGYYRGLKTIRHSGASFGFISQFIRFPEQNFSVIILSNLAGFAVKKEAYHIADILLFDELDNEIEVTLRSNQMERPGLVGAKQSIYTSEQLLKFVGSYYSSELDITYEFKMKGDLLYIYVKGKEIAEARPIGENSFDVYGVRLAFNEENYSGFFLSKGGIKNIYFIKQ